MKCAGASTDSPPPSSQLGQDRSLNTSRNELAQHQSDLLELQAGAEGAKVAALSAVVDGKDAESDAITLHREVDGESFFFSLWFFCFLPSVETHRRNSSPPTEVSSPRAENK